MLNWLQDGRGEKKNPPEYILCVPISQRPRTAEAVCSELIFSIRVYQKLNSTLINAETAATLLATYLGDQGIGGRVKIFRR